MLILEYIIIMHQCKASKETNLFFLHIVSSFSLDIRLCKQDLYLIYKFAFIKNIYYIESTQNNIKTQLN
jgi:hypothetical protein